jgi:hypothetical protein
MARSTWTRKTYVMVAETLRETWTPEADRTVRLAAEQFAGQFKADNPAFDADRFYVAIFGEQR